MKGYEERAQRGQEMTSGQRRLKFREERSSQAAFTSSSGGAVREIRRVSPIPSKRRVPRAAEDFMSPSGRGPASVSPMCKGISLTFEKRR